MSQTPAASLEGNASASPKTEVRNARRVDKYGFYIDFESDDTDFHRSKIIHPQIQIKRNQVELNRESKWAFMFEHWEQFTSQASKVAVLKRRIRKGVPHAVRGEAWKRILDLAAYETIENGKKETVPKFSERYPNLNTLSTENVSSRTIDEIERDLDRTFPNHVLFEEKDGIGQSSLRQVLRWYAAIDPDVGYCQGMGFIAGLLLSYMDQNQAFYCLAGLLQHRHGPFRDLYLPGMIDARKKLFVFGELGKQYLGKLWIHMVKQNVEPSMFATEWIMTMFCRGFSFDMVTRVVDIYCYEGFKIVYRVSLALLKSLESKILKLSFEGILKLIRNISVEIDVVELFEVVWKIKLKTQHILMHEKKVFFYFLTNKTK